MKRRGSGEGSLFFSKTENTWIAEINLPDGSSKRKRSKRQAVVKDWLITQRSAVKDGVFIKDDQLTVSGLLDRYMDGLAQTVRPTTQLSYKNIIRLHLKPNLGHIKLTQLRPDQLQKLYAEKANDGLSPRMVQFIHSVMHQALNQAFKWGLVARNVSDMVQKPKADRKTPTIWTVDQVRIFLDAVKHDRFYPIYVLAVATGMREGEILGLHYEDIDWMSNKVHIRQAVVTIPGKGSTIVEPKSATSKRSVTLPPYAAGILKAHCEGLEDKRSFIFTTSNGTPFSARNLVRHFKNVIEKTGLPNIRFHDLRHYHATYLLTQNVHPRVVQERLGHSSVTLTLSTYSHVLPGLQEEAAEKANGMFS